MPGRVVSCPNCGGQVEFRAGTSLLAVCPYCASAVARVGDDVDELTILGQVAPLADLGSPLSIGISGRARGKSFTIVGCLQLDYGAGPWNEWYAAFDDGQWGWIAEAQGKIYLTFGKAVDRLPSFGQASVGSSFQVGNQTLRVVERRTARFVAAVGELPVQVTPGAHFRYADVQGPKRLFGTIDYGEGDHAEALFLGEELTYDALFDRGVLRHRAPGVAAAAVGMNCPNCGAGVSLKAPDSSQRVTCDACGSLLDCSKGQELYLLSSARARGPEPQIPLSSTGTLMGVKYTVFGHLVRSVEVEGVRYSWEEYLLHADDVGYRWLVMSDGHWTFVEPIHAGDLGASLGAGVRSVRYEGRTYRLFQSATARVDHLRGEFYWKVAVGERASTRDYVAPPHSLSVELTADEVVCSKGTYLSKSEIEHAFGLKKRLGRPLGIAPSQPNPHGVTLRSIFKTAVFLTLATALLAVVFAVRSEGRLVVDAEVALADLALAGTATAEKTSARPIATEPFRTDERANLAIRVESDVNNAWLYVGGVLEDLTLGRSEPFGVEVSFYHGVQGGEAWQEGGRAKTVFLGEVPAGEYVLRFAPEWSTRSAPGRFRLTARSDVFVGSHPVALLAFLWIFPLIATWRHFSFEKKRWAESDFSEG
ncbi:MAG: DUF4178 domain-containing protein [Deltaproteobacteria bacterium]|nr:DUF4178 domain-containing protein [Deltaproteobacteria bacterium]